MRRRFFGCAIATGVALVLAAVGAASTLVETQTPFSMGFTNICRAEAFTATGFIHTKVTVVQSNGGSTLFSIESNLLGVKAAVPLTGARYVVTETTTNHLLVDPDGGPNNSNLVYKLTFVRQGDDGSLIVGDDFTMYVRLHLTVNPNGTTTADRMESEEQPCR